MGMTPMKAIRAKCLDCCCDSVLEVKECPMADCPLYPYRLGHNPYIRKREYTPEQQEAMRMRLEKARQEKALLNNRENLA